MIDLRSLISAVCVTFVALCGFADAQQSPKIHRIGLLTTGFPESLPHLLGAFKSGLREHGYVEGRDVILELRFGEAKPDRLPALAADLVRQKVDVIVAIPNPAVEAARHASRTIPIVMPIGSDPVGVGFVTSLARPGGNITGLSAYSPEVNGKRLDLLKEAIPKLSRVALLMTPGLRGNPIDLKDTQTAAHSLQIRTQFLEVGSLSDLANAFKAMLKERSDAFIVFPGQPTLFAYRKQMIDLAAKSRLPGMYPLADYVDIGGLISYGVNNREMFRRAATYVDKILKGANPAELPIEQPTNFEFVINVNTAKQLGLTIPPNVLARADRVIR